MGSGPSRWCWIREWTRSFKDVPALVMDEKTEFWKETGGILPLWLLREYGIHYDRRHGKLELLASGTSPDQVLDAGATRLNVLWLDRKPYVETRIQNKPMRHLLLANADNVALDLGTTRINLPTVHAADLCPDCGVECSGILGRNVLDLFDVYLDYRAGVLALKGYEKGR